jgi:peptide/nickel transport system substrate-binding protein
MKEPAGLSRRGMLHGGMALAGAAALAAPAARAAGRQAQLAVAMPSNPETIDPHRLRALMTGSILACVVESLVTRDDETMEIRPLLATSWRNIDPLTWEFQLRQGVRFHNGEEFDAESVKFSIERAIDSPLTTNGKTVWPPSFGQKVEIIDPYTVRIVTKVPDPLVPNRLAAESMNMAPPKALAAFKDKYVSTTLIGTGPYKFVEYVVGQHVIMERNPDYWGEPPATPRIVWNIVPDAATRVAALQRGTADVIVNLPIPSIATVTADPNLRVYSAPGSVVSGLLLNTKDTAALKDVRVRQALNHAVDRVALLQNLYQGLGHLSNGVVASRVEYAIDPGAYAYDPDKARTLLAEAGFRDSLELTLWQSTGRYELGVEAAQAITAYFEDVGVHANLQILEWGEFNVRAAGTQFKDALFYGFVNVIWDPQYLLQRFLPTYPTFRYYLADAPLAEQLKRYEGVFAKDERAKLAAACQQALHDQAPWVFLWELNENYGLRKGVQGFKMRPDHLIRVQNAYVEV